MERVLAPAILFGLLLGTGKVMAVPVKVTTMNIEFYGNKDSGRRQAPERQDKWSGNATLDGRDATINSFLDLAGVDPDLIAFQEIVDVPGLTRNLLGNQYECHSYEHSTANHQHVVICHKKSFAFRVGNDDDNFTWEDVAMGRLRPAVHGILSQKGGRDLAHVIAVHLKAMPDQGALRLDQNRLIADHINRRQDSLPVIMLGDLNTYDDEITDVVRTFNDRGISMEAIDIPFQYTYRTSRYRNKFDWMLITDDVDVMGEPKVDGPCNDDWRSGTSFDSLAFYNDNVSDHCPVSATLDL